MVVWTEKRTLGITSARNVIVKADRAEDPIMHRGGLGVAGLALLWTAIPIQAASVEADPKKEYRLSPKDGPWMIYVASFKGDEARDMAHKLVQELRREYKLQAYTFSRTEEQRREEDKKRAEEWRQRFGEGVPMRGKVRIPDEFAVLVGHYKDMDSAHKALDKIKQQKAPSSIPLSKAFIARPGTMAKKGSGGRGRAQVEAAALNPLTRGFVFRNPLAPKTGKD